MEKVGCCEEGERKGEGKGELHVPSLFKEATRTHSETNDPSSM